MTYFLLLLGLFLLYQGGEITVENVVKIGHKFQLSPAFIAAIIIGFGTSLPEFITSFLAAYHGNSGIAVGNILGSNIANILLIYALAIMFFPFSMKQNSYICTSLIYMLSSFGLLWLTSFFGNITLPIAILMLVGFASYLHYALKNTHASSPTISTDQGFSLIIFLKTILGIIFLLVGANFTIDNASLIALAFHVPQSLIAVSVIALGTSLPEISATFAAIRLKNAEIIAGNVVGSCIFNSLLVLGSSALIAPLPFAENLAQTDIWIMLGSAMVCSFFILGTPKKFWGLLGMILYLIYIGTTLKNFF